MTTARCKFQVQSVTHMAYGGRTVKLQTQYDNTVPEDRAFTKATPSGSMEITIDNPAVFDVFTPGANASFICDLLEGGDETAVKVEAARHAKAAYLLADAMLEARLAPGGDPRG